MDKAIEGTCGKSSILGSGMEHNYTGVFKGNFELIVGNSIRFVPSGLQVIEHPFLLLLLSADVFCGGCKAPN